MHPHSHPHDPYSQQPYPHETRRRRAASYPVRDIAQVHRREMDVSMGAREGMARVHVYETGNESIAMGAREGMARVQARGEPAILQ